MPKRSNKQLLSILYLVFFLYNLFLSLGMYINSSFLSEGCACGIPANSVGILFAIGSLGGIWATLMVQKLVDSVTSSSKILFLAAGGTSLLALAGFVFSGSAILVSIFFVLYWMSSYLVIFLADIFVESYSENKTTGGTRGLFLSIAGLSTMLAPLTAGTFANTQGGFSAVYIIGGVIGLVGLLIFGFFARKIKEPKYKKVNTLKGIKLFLQNKNLSGVLIANFLLQFFYSWMIIYTPIYLIQYMGLSWIDVGLIFTVMLLPFVLIEIPLGKIGDRILGEKEIMLTGLIIMIISTSIIAALDTDLLWPWMLVLTLTRVGASALQVSSESYFFKQINESDLSEISIFRLTSPSAFLVGPILGTVFLGFFNFPFKSLYVVLAVILSIALPAIIKIKDSK